MFNWFSINMFAGQERNTKTNIDTLIDNLIEIKKKKRRTSLVSNNKIETCNKAWCITENVLPLTTLPTCIKGATPGTLMKDEGFEIMHKSTRSYLTKT